MTVEQKLAEIVARIIEARYAQSKISPAWIATEGMQVIDPDRAGPQLEYFGCHLHLRQVARQILRKHYEPDDPNDARQHELWPELQSRYPIAGAAKSEDPVYVRLEDMTKADVAYNVARLRSEGQAKLQHADRLETYGKTRHRRRKRRA